MVICFLTDEVKYFSNMSNYFILLVMLGSSDTEWEDISRVSRDGEGEEKKKNVYDREDEP